MIEVTPTRNPPLTGISARAASVAAKPAGAEIPDWLVTIMASALAVDVMPRRAGD